MDSSFTWSNSAPVVLILITISTSMIKWFPDVTEYCGGWIFLLSSGAVLIIFAVPIVWLQVLVGQFTRMGPLGIWNGFPLARGFGIVWIIFIFLNICGEALYTSKIIIYLFSALTSAGSLAWMTCHNEWNAANCQPVIFKNASSLTDATLPSFAFIQPFEHRTIPQNRSFPANEFYLNSFKFNAQNSVALLLIWILILLPLVQGPKSLARSLFIGFPSILFLNALLFFRAMTLPGRTDGIKYLIGFGFRSVPYRAVPPEFILRLVTLAFGFSFGTEYGSAFVIGKYAGPKTFLLFHVLSAVIVGFVFIWLNNLKMAAFVGYYLLATGERMDDIYGPHHLVFTPQVLSSLPAAQFWLLVEFFFTLSCSVPTLSMGVEASASCAAEFLPGSLGRRAKLPQNLPLTIFIVILGFFCSLLLSYAHSVNLNIDYQFSVNDIHKLVTFLVIFLLIAVIVPLGVSKVANAGRVDLLAFIRNQESRTSAKARKILAIISFVIAGVLFFLLPLFSYSLYWTIGYTIFRRLDAVKVVLFTLPIVLIVIVAAVQCILFCVDSIRNPCCPPLGQTSGSRDKPATLAEITEMDNLI